VHKVLALRRHRNEASEMAADYYRKHVLVRFCLPLWFWFGAKLWAVRCVHCCAVRHR